MRTAVQDRFAAGAASAIVTGLLGYLLWSGLDISWQAKIEQSMALLDIAPPAPPPPPHHPEVKTVRLKLGTPARPASARNLRNKATDIVVHPPVVVLPPPPPPPPVIAASKPGIGFAANTGASDRAGPGQGSGGQGNGTGSGGNGNGDGGGDTPPVQIGGHMGFSDLPRDLREAKINGIVHVRYHVEPDGRATDCVVPRSSGNAELDRLTCQLIERRFRFRPSRTADGEAVESTIVETHSWFFHPQDDPGDAEPPG